MLAMMSSASARISGVCASSLAMLRKNDSASFFTCQKCSETPQKDLLQHNFWILYRFYLLKPYLRGKWRQMTCFSMSMVRKWFFKKICSPVLEFPCDRPQRASFRASPTASRREDMIFLGINDHDNRPIGYVAILVVTKLGSKVKLLCCWLLRNVKNHITQALSLLEVLTPFNLNFPRSISKKHPLKPLKLSTTRFKKKKPFNHHHDHHNDHPVVGWSIGIHKPVCLGHSSWELCSNSLSSWSTATFTFLSRKRKWWHMTFGHSWYMDPFPRRLRKTLMIRWNKRKRYMTYDFMQLW